MKEEIQIKDIKEIIEEITNQERKKYNLDINLTPTTIVGYYKNDTFKKKLKLTKNPIAKFLNVMLPLEFRGWYDINDKNIFIILDYYSKNCNNNKYNSLIEVILTTYHEITHKYQDKYPKNYYYSFLMEIEKYIILKNNNYYYNHHDEFLLEIDANLSGITRTIEYLKKYPNFYQRNKEYIEKKHSKYLLDYQIYNEQAIFEEFHKIMKKESESILKDISILNIFYKKNGKFKSLSEILFYTKQYKISPKITQLILGSKSFIKQLNFQEITLDEREYIINLLENLYQQEMKKQEIITNNYEKKIFKLKEKLYQTKNILEKLNWLILIINQLIDIQIEKLEKLSNNLYYDRIPTILLNGLAEENKKRSYNKLPKIP